MRASDSPNTPALAQVILLHILDGHDPQHTSTVESAWQCCCYVVAAGELLDADVGSTVMCSLPAGAGSLTTDENFLGVGPRCWFNQDPQDILVPCNETLAASMLALHSFRHANRSFHEALLDVSAFLLQRMIIMASQ